MRKIGGSWIIEGFGGAGTRQYGNHIAFVPGTNRAGIVFEDRPVGSSAGKVRFAYEVRAFSDLNQIF